MSINVGNVDRAIRGLVGLFLIAAPFLGLFGLAVSGTVSYAMIAIGLVLVGTALFRFCPAYRLLGLSTCRS
ncbi:MAG: DUF2892 domain-containing protein [Hyphomicrobiales bacterium]